MTSSLNLDTKIKLENHLKEGGIENNVREQIVLLLEGKHKKRDIIENKVIQNLKKQGILEQVFEQIFISDKSNGLGDVKNEGDSQSEEAHYTTSFTETLSTDGGGDGKQKELNSSQGDKITAFSENNGSAERRKSFTHSSIQRKSFSSTEQFNEIDCEEEYKDESPKKITSLQQKRIAKETENIVTTESEAVTQPQNENCKASGVKMNKNHIVDDKKPNSSKSLNLLRNRKSKIENNCISLEPSDERVFSSLCINDTKLDLGEISSEQNDSLLLKLNPNKRHLHFEILSGKSFLDHLLEESFSMFLICLYFQGQRFWTQPTACNSQPNFNAGFVFELTVNELGFNHMASAYHLLGINDLIHLVLLQVLPSGEKFLISSHFLEWRFILSLQDSQKTHLELKGVGAESNVTIGIIEIRLTLVPKLEKCLKQEEVQSKINSEKRSETEKDRIFLLYAKMWWKEYLAIRPDHAHRTVKIFQRDENSTMRPVFNFIQVMKVGRPILEFPREAAWFVSLFLFESSTLLGTLPATEQWWYPHTFLCLKKGDCENHATLLCSLFLGFGLDAYVCIGSKEGNIPWAWVVTCGRNNRAIFWESTTGAHYEHSVDKSSMLHPYKTIGCVFSNTSFYANIQETDKVQMCDFNFTNRSLWKNMSEAAIASVIKGLNIPLMPGWTDSFLHSQDMETELRHLIMEYRNDISLPTRWDVELCHLIAPLLTVYEMEHKMGVVIGTEDLDDMLSKHIPEGFALKALPIRVTPMNNRRVLGYCLQNSIMKSIISCPEANAKLALKVHTYVFPENILSVWLIIACKYYAG